MVGFQMMIEWQYYNKSNKLSEGVYRDILFTVFIS